MINVRRESERRHVQEDKYELCQTFWDEGRSSPLAGGFGALAGVDEMWLEPGGRAAPQAGEDTEAVTYVHSGALAHEDALGCSNVIQVGEFHWMTTGGLHHAQINASQEDKVHFFRVSMRSSEVGQVGAYSPKRFTEARRHNLSCAVASPDGHQGSLRTHQDVIVYSSILDSGRHLVHELLPGRVAWLHVVSGQVALRDLVLTQGDGVGIIQEPSLSLSIQQDTEILLIDLGSDRRSRRQTHRPGATGTRAHA